MITDEQRIGPGQRPLTYFVKEVGEIVESSGSLPWLHTEVSWGILENIDAWVSFLETLL